MGFGDFAMLLAIVALGCFLVAEVMRWVEKARNNDEGDR